jgi:hypothetical protein
MNAKSSAKQIEWQHAKNGWYESHHFPAGAAAVASGSGHRPAKFFSKALMATKRRVCTSIKLRSALSSLVWAVTTAK